MPKLSMSVVALSLAVAATATAQKPAAEKAGGRTHVQERRHRRMWRTLGGAHRTSVQAPLLGAVASTLRAIYSARSVLAGSTRAARRAGSQLAATAIVANTPTAAPSVSGSLGLTSKSSVRR